MARRHGDVGKITGRLQSMTTVTGGKYFSLQRQTSVCNEGMDHLKLFCMKWKWNKKLATDAS